jgi:nucleoside-diphosphate-sugar epimerase
MMRAMPQTVVITGAAGRIGTILRTHLARPDRILRLHDIAKLPNAWTGPLTDSRVLDEVLTDADAVIHLAGQSRESDMRDVLENNAYGTYHLLEAMRRKGVKRLVLASSNHAVGFHERAATPLSADVPVRPDTLYGWSKAAIEALARLYTERYGIDVIAVRIGICVPQPTTARHLALWLSPDDCGRLFDACLTADAPGYRTIWGVSRNTRGFLSLSQGRSLGYDPVDDSEAFAAAVTDQDPVVRRIGGEWCEIPLGEPY